MRTRSILLAFATAVGVAITAVDAATAQGMQGRMGPSMRQGGTDQETMGHGMTRGGQNMEQCMMHGMGSGMTGQHMGRGMMMGSGMMGSGMMQGGTRSGMGALFGSRVTPVMNLSIEDVRGYLALQLEHLKNKRLKVDRHTGAIEYES